MRETQAVHISEEPSHLGLDEAGDIGTVVAAALRHVLQGEMRVKESLLLFHDGAYGVEDFLASLLGQGTVIKCRCFFRRKLFFLIYRLKMKHQYFVHLMGRVDSLEKTLMLEGTGGRRRRG